MFLEWLPSRRSSNNPPQNEILQDRCKTTAQAGITVPASCMSAWEKPTHFGNKQACFLWSKGTTMSFKPWGCRYQGTPLKNGWKSKSTHVTAPYSNNAGLLEMRLPCLDMGVRTESPASTQRWVILGTCNTSVSSLISLWSTEKWVAVIVWKLCTPWGYQLWQSN